MGVQDNKYDNCYNGQFIQVYMHQTLQHNKFYPALLPGFKRCGGLVVAQTKDRLTFLKRRAAIGRYVDDDFSHHQTYKVIIGLRPLINTCKQSSPTSQIG